MPGGASGDGRSMMLQVVNLSVNVGDKRVLDRVSFYIEEGKSYALFGANGSGKSSLLNTLMGNPMYKVVSGRIMFKGRDITDMPTDERVKLGMGIAFQSPPKVSNVRMRELLNYCMRLKNSSEERMLEYARKLNMLDFLDRKVNEGFSGGEVKRSEILQLLVMDPDFLMFDEPDSGVDLENISIVGNAMSEAMERHKPPEQRKKAALIITHAGHILDYATVDYGMILYNGRIACVGDPYEQLRNISEHGYEGCVEKCLKEA
ncbi:MAG: ABC transporter related protein [Methanosarcinales archeaon 56_1174]|nr:MAG: ABC transporter related protein [Euryarchaeota archaeon 55_53]KUK29761.1 MAG: ABC transporter related protein [Methanosarcinales archeaon 56_1174]